MNRDLAAQAMEIAERLARREFARRFERDELVADAMSMAWQAARQTTNPQATASTIAGYAVQQVKVARQFQWSIRTVDNPRHWQDTVRQDFDAVEYCRPGDDPATIAQVRIDLTEWLSTLSDQQRTVATLFATGCRTTEIAALLKKTPGRISQLRDELRVSWAEFCGEG